VNKTFIISFFIILCNLSCKKNESLPNAPPLEPRNLVSNDSFESNGVPTLDGWTGRFDPDTSLRRYYSFSNDTPPGGGHWSFLVENPDQVEIRLSTDVSIAGIFRDHKLTVWAKAVNLQTELVLYVSAMGSHIASGRSVAVNDSVWKEYSITIDIQDSTSYRAFPDSTRILRVQFEVRQSSLQGKAFFDMVRLE
jgi:hypothetical protein